MQKLWQDRLDYLLRVKIRLKPYYISCKVIDDNLRSSLENLAALPEQI